MFLNIRIVYIKLVLNLIYMYQCMYGDIVKTSNATGKFYTLPLHLITFRGNG